MLVERHSGPVASAPPRPARQQEAREENAPERPDLARRPDWEGLLVWVLGFGVVVYLGLKGGGFDPLVHDQVGIAAWWALLAATVVGALPRRRPEPLAWAGLALLAGFAAWTALSLGWTESIDKTWVDLARVLTYLGVFALALLSRGPKAARRMVGAVGAGVTVVALVGLASRLHPAWFSQGSTETARFLAGSNERLSYPLDYWNALAALVAIGLPLVIQVAADARTLVLRGLGAAAVPPLALTAFLTLSRGGIAASVVALAVFVAFASDRLPKLLTLAWTGSGAAVLIAAAASRPALQQGLHNTAAAEQGDQMLKLTLAVCVVVAAGQIAATALLRGRRPAWARLPRIPALSLAGGGLAVLIIAAGALDAPGRISAGWQEFKGEGGPGQGASRLASSAGEHRYQLWSAALDENATHPLTGTGSGTFEFWWDRRGRGSIVRDTHSLYMQTLGELGIVGLALLGGFLILVVVGGVGRVLRARERARAQLAAALAGIAAFCVTAGFDWIWQVPVAPVAVLLLASVLLTAGARRRRPRHRPVRPAVRVALCVPAAAAIVAIAIPLASGTALRSSEAQARQGSLEGALSAARTARDVQPGAAGPRLQEALVLEGLGDARAAAKAARAAVERGPMDWRNWLVLSRLEAERGRVAGAIRAYRRVVALDPHALLLRR